MERLAAPEALMQLEGDPPAIVKTDWTLL